MNIAEINQEVAQRLSCFKNYNRELVEIRQSNIPCAGLGLFAKSDIPRHTVIDAYHGRRINLEQFNQVSDDECCYIMTINKYEYITAGGSEKNFVSYVNDACGLTRTGFRNNCRFELDESGKEMLLTTTRNIRAGQELFCPYGKSYWNTVKSWQS